MTPAGLIAAALIAVTQAAAPTVVGEPQVSQPTAPAAKPVSGELNDFPTDARVEYVFVCMASNGQTRKALRECSCAIDHIAAVIDYDAYTAAETVLGMRQTSGPRVDVFRETSFANDLVRPLRAAEAEADILCFTPGS